MRPARTVLELKIRERRQTIEEFAQYAEAFAREHGEPGTLSLRHLHRLIAGKGPKGQPLGPVRPATARLLEHIFGTSIDELLASPDVPMPVDDSTAELRQMLHASRRIDAATIALLNDQLMNIRRLDRELGAIIAHEEVCTKTNQVERLLTHSLSLETREQLAALLSELCCLAGWQALDLGRITQSWQHYEQARIAALQSNIPAYVALAEAGRAFALVDAGETSVAVEILVNTRKTADLKCSRLIRSWIAAAHGETLAANGQRDGSLRAFDEARTLLPSDSFDPDGPYVALDPVHLGRWRGQALARFAEPEAVDVLMTALDNLDSTFVRAETALRVDLATAFKASGETADAIIQAQRAEHLATQIGSERQRRRILTICKLYNGEAIQRCYPWI